MKNTKKWNAILRMAGFIAIVAMIGFSMASCEQLFNKGGDDDNDQSIFFPEVLAGDNSTWEGSGVRWNKDGESVYVVFRNYFSQGSRRTSFSFTDNPSSFSLNAKDGDKYTVWRYSGWNADEEKDEYAIFSFTAIVEADGKLTISNATLIEDVPSHITSIAHAVDSLNGTYTKAAN